MDSNIRVRYRRQRLSTRARSVYQKEPAYLPLSEHTQKGISTSINPRPPVPGTDFSNLHSAVDPSSVIIATRFPSLAVRASMLMAAKEVGNGYATVGRGD